jgi:hypothetical protein
MILFGLITLIPLNRDLIYITVSVLEINHVDFDSQHEQLRRQHELYEARKIRLEHELRRREQEELESKLKKLEESENRMRIAAESRLGAAELHRHRLAQAYQQSREYNCAKRNEVS